MFPKKCDTIFQNKCITLYSGRFSKKIGRNTHRYLSSHLGDKKRTAKVAKVAWRDDRCELENVNEGSCDVFFFDLHT